MRPADHELTGWVDMILDLIIEQFAYFLYLAFTRGIRMFMISS
jgi:hypothetical protein